MMPLHALALGVGSDLRQHNQRSEVFYQGYYCAPQAGDLQGEESMSLFFNQQEQDKAGSGSDIVVVTLILAISSLDLFMDALLDFAFENACPCGLIESCEFKDMGRIDPVISSPSHDAFAVDLELIHRHLKKEGREAVRTTSQEERNQKKQ